MTLNNPNSISCATVFWDFENCSIPKGITGFLVVRKITELVKKDGVQLTRISAIGHTNQLAKGMAEQLEEAGVALQNITSIKDSAADMAIALEIYKTIHFNKENHCIYLITGDRDFCKLIHFIESIGYKIVLVHNETTSDSLLHSASNKISWQSLFSGLINAKESPQEVVINTKECPAVINPKECLAVINTKATIDYTVLIDHLNRIGGDVAMDTMGSVPRIRSMFKQHGFATLGSFMESARNDGIVTIQKIGSHAPIIRLAKKTVLVHNDTTSDSLLHSASNKTSWPSGLINAKESPQDVVINTKATIDYTVLIDHLNRIGGDVAMDTMGSVPRIRSIFKQHGFATLGSFMESARNDGIVTIRKIGSHAPIIRLAKKTVLVHNETTSDSLLHSASNKTSWPSGLINAKESPQDVVINTKATVDYTVLIDHLNRIGGDVAMDTMGSVPRIRSMFKQHGFATLGSFMESARNDGIVTIQKIGSHAPIIRLAKKTVLVHNETTSDSLLHSASNKTSWPSGLINAKESPQDVVINTKATVDYTVLIDHLNRIGGDVAMDTMGSVPRIRSMFKQHGFATLGSFMESARNDGIVTIQKIGSHAPIIRLTKKTLLVHNETTSDSLLHSASNKTSWPSGLINAKESPQDVVINPKECPAVINTKATIVTIQQRENSAPIIELTKEYDICFQKYSNLIGYLDQSKGPVSLAVLGGVVKIREESLNNGFQKISSYIESAKNKGIVTVDQIDIKNGVSYVRLTERYEVHEVAEKREERLNDHTVLINLLNQDKQPVSLSALGSLTILKEAYNSNGFKKLSLYIDRAALDGVIIVQLDDYYNSYITLTKNYQFAVQQAEKPHEQSTNIQIVTALDHTLDEHEDPENQESVNFVDRLNENEISKSATNERKKCVIQ